jgi:hypothetical protein
MRGVADVMSHWGREYGGSATLTMAYIQEAHGSDEWPITSQRMAAAPVSIPQHKSLGEREAAAAAFVGDFKVDTGITPVVLDGIGNAFQTLYAAWPLRWFVFSLGGADGMTPVVDHIGVPEDASFDFTILDDILAAGRVDERGGEMRRR